MPLSTKLAAAGISGGESVVLELIDAQLASADQPPAAPAIGREENWQMMSATEVPPNGAVQQAADAPCNVTAATLQPVPPPPAVRSNLVPTLCTLEGRCSRRRWSVQPMAPHTLGDVLRQPAAMEARQMWDGGGQLFLYQLLSGLAELHAAGKHHGRLDPEHLLLTRDG